jgi:hypothetical protein
MRIELERVVCPECLGALGRHKPQKFPTIEEYEEALRRFPGPIWGSVEEADRAWGESWKEGEAHRSALEESRIGRV